MNTDGGGRPPFPTHRILEFLIVFLYLAFIQNFALTKNAPSPLHNFAHARPLSLQVHINVIRLVCSFQIDWHLQIRGPFSVRHLTLTLLAGLRKEGMGKRTLF